MSRAGIRSARSQSRSVAQRGRTRVDTDEGESSHHGHLTRSGLKFHRFIGVSLGGGKTDKTSLSVVEYYPLQGKIFLSRLFDKIRTDGDISADLQVHRLISQCPPPVESVAFDVPLQFPSCVVCRLKCPGYESCQEPQISWMWKRYTAQSAKKKRSQLRLFTPYTERCVEQYLQSELEETFHVPHALGANSAPLTARAHFITRRLKVPAIEVFPKLSLWRIGSALHVSKSHLREHRHWEAGQASRAHVLARMMDKNLAFIYDQDLKTLADSPQAFDSFLCALTGLLSFLGQCETRPKGFPRKESWLEIPKKVFTWP